MTRLEQIIVDMLHNEGVKSIEYYDAVSERLILIATDKGIYKYTDTLYKQVKPHEELWENCNTGEISEGIFDISLNNISTTARQFS